MHVLEKHEGTFSLMVHNSGKGVEYHPASPAQHPKMKYATSIRIDDIANAKILDDGSFIAPTCHVTPVSLCLIRWCVVVRCLVYD